MSFIYYIQAVWIVGFIIYLCLYKTVYKKLNLSDKKDVWEWWGIFSIAPLMAFITILTLVVLKFDAQEKQFINQPMPGEAEYMNAQMDKYGLISPKKSHKDYTPEEVMQKLLQ